MQLAPDTIHGFQETVWRYYRAYGRTMPWREDHSPYKVLVSELMLQQTQVSRVIPKFETFLYTCPDIVSLARLPLGEVLVLWSGLGYNRRAKFLHQAAQIVWRDHAGQLPTNLAELVKLPGIGKNTAGAILAYAYNQPVVFIETNIRTVLFHHFYAQTDELVGDRELESLVEQTLDHEQPREWYWALMDYGAHLKSTAGGRLSTSKHYAKQPPLKGSLREMRGRILKALVSGPIPLDALRSTVEADERFELALEALMREGLVSHRSERIGLTGVGQPS